MAKKKKKKNSVLRIVLGVILSGIVLGLIFGYHYYSYIFKSNVKLEEDQVVVYIHSDWTYDDVLSELQEKSILRNVESFEWVAERKSYPDLVKPGKYTIQDGLNNNELVNLLRSGNQTPVKITFHNISRLSQLAGIVSKQIEADSMELMDAFLNPDWMQRKGLKKETVQAIFIPNTYEVYWSLSGEEFTQRMYQEFQHFWTADNKAVAKEMGLTPVEVTTLASIVEAETKKKDEMPKVAGLYLNRLTIGMRLQSDPTVVFAKNKPNVHRVYYDDLKIESPYNTYIHTGLPPGPIGFPSKAALNAVLKHDKNNYIYMCAKPDYSGYHNFAATYKEHQRNAKKYRNFLRREGIR